MTELPYQDFEASSLGQSTAVVVEFWDSPLTISVLINVESSIPNRYKWKSSSVTCILNPNFNQVFTQLASESISSRVAHNEVFLEKVTSLGGLIFHLGYN